MQPRPFFNGRAQVLVGDTTSHGGVVVSGSPKTLINGHPVARIGDMVTCPLCKPHLFKIVEGYSPFTDNNMAIALSGHKTACGATLIASAKGADMPDAPAPSSPAPDSEANLLKTGFDPEVNELVAGSPSLTKDLQTLRDEGWIIKDGPAGDGSTINRGLKTITMDSNLKTDPKTYTQVLSHEVGHGIYPYRSNLSSKSAYLEGALDDEGVATMKNIQVQREIIKSRNIDISIAGQPVNRPSYIQAFDQYLKDGDLRAAIRKIGNVVGSGEYTSNTKETYADYHGKWYDKHYGKK
jgi:uncharacterized Zn-binding protein involved in type VI secretion